MPRSPARRGSASRRRHSTMSPAKPAAPAPPSTATSRASLRCCARSSSAKPRSSRPSFETRGRRRTDARGRRRRDIMFRAAEWLAEHPALQFVMTAEPDVLLPHLAFEGADRVLSGRGSSGSPPALKPILHAQSAPESVEVLAERVARPHDPLLPRAVRRLRRSCRPDLRAPTGVRLRRSRSRVHLRSSRR